MSFNHLILSRPLLLPSVFPSIRVFSSESALCITWPKYWSSSFSTSSSSEYSGLTYHTVQNHQFFQLSASFMIYLSHPYMTAGKTIALTTQTFVGKMISLLFNTLSRFVIAILPGSQASFNFKCGCSHRLHWFWSPRKWNLTVSTFSPSICHVVIGPDAMIFTFWKLSFKPAFSLSSFTFIKRLFSTSSLSAIKWYHLHIWGYWYFSRQSWFQLVIHPA